MSTLDRRLERQFLVGNKHVRLETDGMVFHMFEKAQSKHRKHGVVEQRMEFDGGA